MPDEQHPPTVLPLVTQRLRVIPLTPPEPPTRAAPPVPPETQTLRYDPPEPELPEPSDEDASDTAGRFAFVGILFDFFVSLLYVICILLLLMVVLSLYFRLRGDMELSFGPLLDFVKRILSPRAG